MDNYTQIVDLDQEEGLSEFSQNYKEAEESIRSTIRDELSLRSTERGQDRGSIFRRFMKKLNTLGPAKWDITNLKDEK